MSPALRFSCVSLVASTGLLVAGTEHWAFRPLGAAVPPAVSDASWPRSDLDRFVLAQIESAGLRPSPEADRVTSIRHVTLDLTGLPPGPGEIDAFVRDEGTDAHERVIDRILASPRYGERWGRHWLDLARHADSSGYHNDLDRPQAWKYRDYVIRSFNEDKPYERFVGEQLAGDEIDGADLETLIATGFCRNGPSNDDNMGKNAAAIAQYRADQLDDVIATASTVFLGVTIGCARCHDHKTEPFSQQDYYRLLAIFNGTAKHGLVPGTQDRNDKTLPVDPSIQIQALVERGPVVPPTRVMFRGDASNLGEEVWPGLPSVLAPRPPRFPEPGPEARTSLRRRTLAEWITAPDNALAWRVHANRVWHQHFGRGIVATPGDFGSTGSPPSHPELLDHLAARLIAGGGRLKPLHKEILLSATYRQSSRSNEAGLAADPANTMLWRMNLRRMEAEVLRDSILAASGQLNLTMGGPGIKPRVRSDLLPASQRNKWPALQEERPEQWRRSVYIYVKRQLLLPMLELFDPKPDLAKWHGKPIPVWKPEDAFMGKKTKNVAMQGFYRFHRHGQSGIEMAEVFPHLARHADHLCMIRSLHAESNNHGPALFQMNTGFVQAGRPCMGSWVTYGLGTESGNLPAFVVLLDHQGAPVNGALNWSNGFMPATFQGVPFRTGGEPIAYLSPPRGVSPDRQRARLDDLKASGMLDTTLVIWGGEFGRSPVAENGKGRDHHPKGFTMWLAGGGIKGGIVHGATDEFGYHAVEKRVSVPDLHATILNQLGFDHERLTYPHGGRDYRLTDVSGRVIRSILA